MIVLEEGWRRELSAEALKTSIAGPADNGPSDTRAGKWSIGTNGRNCIEKRCHPTKYISAHYNILCTRTSSHPISTCLMVGFALTWFCPNKYLLALPPNSFPPSLLACWEQPNVIQIKCALCIVPCLLFMGQIQLNRVPLFILKKSFLQSLTWAWLAISCCIERGWLDHRAGSQTGL